MITGTVRETLHQAPRRLRNPAWCVLAAIVFWRGGREAQAQGEIRNFTQPILVLNTGGHHGVVQAMAFTHDGKHLLSAGLDKVVNVWDLRDEQRPELGRVIRPPLWRGLGGAIYAMALAPVADAQGQRLLAVAGYGVDSTRGNIVLFQYPGRGLSPTGDLVGILQAGDPALPPAQRPGHSDVVNRLAFSPDGKFLASAGSDATVRVWNVEQRRSVALVGHVGPVWALAFQRDGRRIVSGGADGVLRLWNVADLANPRLEAQAATGPALAGDPEGVAINTLAASPDDRWIVVGRENGLMMRYDGAGLRNPATFPAAKGAVEALAVSPDGARLAVSLLKYPITRRSDRPRAECSIELRRLPDGAVQSVVMETTNLARACAFSPDGQTLAVAGGDGQAIYLHDLRNPARPRVDLQGQGSSIWDVGFSRQGLTVGYSRERGDVGKAAPAYDGFDCVARRFTPVDVAQLDRALTTFEGWTVRPIDLYTLDVVNAQGQGHRLQLDPQRDRRWWAYSFIPPKPGHPRPTLAVGCEAGVVLFRLADGLRTRFFAGHAGAVYSLAPSPDGKWLATGSSDQTVRLWTLSGCDSVPPLGAQFNATPQGGWTVAAVAPGSFAQAMDLQPGDAVVNFFIANNTPLDPKAFLARMDSVPPNTLTYLQVRRGRDEFPVGTTKRDAPALTLFPGLNREWVCWTPAGYYDTSIEGDRKHLGWHRNRPRMDQPSRFDPAEIFEKELRLPAVLDRLIATADPLQAVPPAAAPAAKPEVVVQTASPPSIQITEPPRPPDAPLETQAETLPIRVVAEAEDRRPVSSVRVLVNSRQVTRIPVDPPQPLADLRFNVPLAPGLNRVNVIASNDQDKERTESFDLVALGPKPPGAPSTSEPSPKQGRLAVLAIGIDRFAGAAATLPWIPFAAEDARELSRFVSAPQGTPRFQDVKILTMLGSEATTSRIQNAFQDLDLRRRRQELGPGDSVIVWIESHFIQFNQRGSILGSDAVQAAPNHSVSATEVADALGLLADYGCRVLLLIDVLHEKRPASSRGNHEVGEWARRLYRKNVVTAVASIHGPSLRVVSRGHGAFAQGVLNTLNIEGANRLPSRSDDVFTLADFQDALSRNVLALTNRQQHARCYIPATIPSRHPVFAPIKAPPLKNAQRPEGAAPPVQVR